MISEKILTEMRDDTIRLFYNKDNTYDCLTGNAHASCYWGQINKWITNYAKNKLGVEVHRDKYFSTSEQIKEWDEDLRNYYGNIWFDIPATVGYENRPKFCLQAHMDMVIAGEAYSGWGWKTQPIIPVQEGDNDTGNIHSKDNKTSLGSDDLSSAATILGMVSNKNFNHGPIRVLISTDEEIGGGSPLLGTENDKTPNGAKVLGDIDYLINIDEPNPFYVIAGSSRNKQFTFNNNETTPSSIITRAAIDLDDTSCKQYSIECKDLIGGHSAIDIIGQGNAVEFISRLWSRLIEIDANSPFYIVNCYSDQDTGNLVANQIPHQCNLIVRSKATKDQIDQKITELMNELKQDSKYEKDFSPTRPDKKTPSITCTEETDTSKIITKVMNVDNSNKLFKFISEFYSQKNIEGKDYACNIGAVKILKSQNITEICSNLSPIKVDLNNDGTNFDMTFSVMPRSIEIKGSSNGALNNYLTTSKRLCNQYFGDNCFHDDGDYLSFVADDHSLGLIDKLVDGYKLSDISKEHAKRYYEIGGLEISDWYSYVKTLGLTALGCRVTYEHNIKETFYLESIKPLIKTIAYTMQNLKK